MIKVSPTLSLDESELQFSFIRAPGPGGQNVNKVASAVQLRFNVRDSASLPDDVKTRLIALLSTRLTVQGELIIKASSYRTQERNKQDALRRLIDMLLRVAKPPKKRHKTKPTYASKQRRLDTKKMRGKVKALRKGI